MLDAPKERLRNAFGFVAFTVQAKHYRKGGKMLGTTALQALSFARIRGDWVPINPDALVKHEESLKIAIQTIPEDALYAAIDSHLYAHGERCEDGKPPTPVDVLRSLRIARETGIKEAVAFCYVRSEPQTNYAEGFISLSIPVWRGTRRGSEYIVISTFGGRLTICTVLTEQQVRRNNLCYHKMLAAKPYQLVCK